MRSDVRPGRLRVASGIVSAHDDVQDELQDGAKIAVTIVRAFPLKGYYFVTTKGGVQVFAHASVFT